MSWSGIYQNVCLDLIWLMGILQTNFFLLVYLCLKHTFLLPSFCIFLFLVYPFRFCTSSWRTSHMLYSLFRTTSYFSFSIITFAIFSIILSCAASIWVMRFVNMSNFMYLNCKILKFQICFPSDWIKTSPIDLYRRYNRSFFLNQ